MDIEQQTNREQTNEQKKVNAEAFLMNEKYPFIPLSFHSTYGTDTQHNKGTFQKLGTTPLHLWVEECPILES